jgi:hypothetical protein
VRKLLIIPFLCAITLAQETTPAPPPGNVQEQRQRERVTMGNFKGTAGAITAIKDDVITIKSRNGDEVKVKVSDKTLCRKDQNPAKLADFKVGDMIIAGGDQAADGSWNATFVASRPAGAGGSQMMMSEGLGKVFIVGKVKEINGTKLTIERPDKESQIIEVDENTSFKKQSESITLADIKPGDSVFGRGAVKDGVFVPTILTVGEPQIRMQTVPR